jgi:hypothetical protein
MFGKRFTSISLAGVLAVLVLAFAAGPAAGSSDDGTRSFHGTVASVAKNGKSLTVNRAGGQTRFVVNAKTAYEHISGLGGLSRGTAVEVHAFRNGDRWIATRIEANPGGRGGDDSRGDDSGGDDHGSGGHGSDD